MRKIIGLGTLLVLPAALPGMVATVAQEKSAGGQKETAKGQDNAAAMQEYMKLIVPGEAHKHLDYFVGKWKTTTKVWSGGPDRPPTETPGASEFAWVLGGRFVQETHKGTFMGMPYEGQGLTGYDNFRKMYVADWASTMATHLQQMTGQRAPSGKLWVFYGEMDEPGLVIGRMVKFVRRIDGPDKFTFQVIDLHAGEDYKPVEIVYERVK